MYQTHLLLENVVLMQNMSHSKKLYYCIRMVLQLNTNITHKCDSNKKRINCFMLHT